MNKLQQHFANLQKHAALVNEGFGTDEALRMVSQEEPVLTASQVYEAQLSIISQSMNKTLYMHFNALTPFSFDRLMKEQRFTQWIVPVKSNVPFKLTHVQLDERNGWVIGFYDYISELEELLVPLHCLSIDNRLQLLKAIENIL